MNKTILDQLEIDVTQFMGVAEETAAPKNPPVFEAVFAKDVTIASNTSALLQVDIAEKGTGATQLKAALEPISKKFTSVTIFIDMQLALLVYSIIMPYMSLEQLQDIVTRRKLDWVTKNIAAINGATIPWSIATDREQSVTQAKNANISKLKTLIKSDDSFRKNIRADVIALKAYLSNTHKITSAQYQHAENIYDTAIEDYLITKIATIKVMHTFNNCEHNYIATHAMHSYNFLQQIAALQPLPQHLILQLKKLEGDEPKELLTSTELNKKMHEHDFLSKISDRRSYLEHSIKSFSGNVYLQSSNRTLLACNKQHGLTLGVEDESYLEGKTFEELLANDDAHSVADIVNEITATNATKVLIENYYYLGKRRPYLTIKMPLRNKKNKCIGIIGFSKTIENENELEKIKNSEPEDIMQAMIEDNQQPDHDTASLISIIEHMPGHVFWQDADGKVLGCNNYHAVALGFDNAEGLIGKYPSDFLTEKYAKEAKATLEEIAETGKPLRKEEIYKTTDGFMVMISHKTPVKNNDGKVIGALVTAIDISKDKQHKIKLEEEKKQLEVANKFKEQFIKDMEHDMRVPFTGLCNMTQLCAEEETDPTKKNQLHEISNCAKDLLAYCDELLKFSKKESCTNNNSLVPLKELINSTANTSIVAIRAKRLEFELDYDDSLPHAVMTDSYRLTRMLSNLMSNAVKYTDEGHIKLAIKLESKSKNELTISFTVTDTGIGISKEDQENIFNKYNMLNYTQRNLATGQGLGLSEVKRFVQDLGGTIDIESEIAKGTSITVRLSFTVPEENSKKEA